MWPAGNTTAGVDRGHHRGRCGLGCDDGHDQRRRPAVLLYLLSGNDPPQVNRANIVTYYFLNAVPADS